MDKVVLDSAVLAKLEELQNATEIYDASGKLYGTFQPRKELTRLGWTDTEIEAILARPRKRGRSAAELRAELLRLRPL
jgi:hypothetical protein